tara:strand:- start:62934 stop:63212 length:279 start_codon:yes stop_codon:yes gene_type:complete
MCNENVKSSVVMAFKEEDETIELVIENNQLMCVHMANDRKDEIEVRNFGDMDKARAYFAYRVSQWLACFTSVGEVPYEDFNNHMLAYHNEPK